jgi:hypothetical protein
MPRRDLDGLLETLAVDQIETGNPFLGLGEGTVGYLALTVAHAYRHGPIDVGETMAHDPDTRVSVPYPLPDSKSVSWGTGSVGRRPSMEIRAMFSGLLVWMPGGSLSAIRLRPGLCGIAFYFLK